MDPNQISTWKRAAIEDMLAVEPAGLVEEVLSDGFELVSVRPVTLSFIPRQVRATRQERRFPGANPHIWISVGEDDTIQKTETLCGWYLHRGHTGCDFLACRHQSIAPRLTIAVALTFRRH